MYEIGVLKYILSSLSLKGKCMKNTFMHIFVASIWYIKYWEMLFFLFGTSTGFFGYGTERIRAM